jgi:DNA-binding NarL/FixJ family response regulator
MTIAIIDQYPLIRSGIKYILKDHFADLTIIEPGNLTTQHKAYPVKDIDVIIMGISQLSGIDNLNLIKGVKKWCPFAKLIVYDEEPELSMVVKYFGAGVNGYLSKQTDIQKLIDCIDEVLNLRRYISQEIMHLALDWYSDTVLIQSHINVELSPRQYEITKYLCEGMTTSWIAIKLKRKVSTISTIKSHIYQKLKVDNIVKLREQFSLVRVKIRN